jgi:signal peptidase I
MSRRRSVIRELLETAVLTIGIFLIVKVAVQNFKVEGNSMLPNLHNGEYILVNKVDYMLHAPQRGDVVVFRAVAAEEPDRDFIKRIIGLPGETVEVRANHHVYINGRELIEPYRLYTPNYTFGPKKVPPHDYFVLGDHRSNSDDSHMWASTWLRRQDIIGKAWIAYWPPKEAELIQASPRVALGR